MAREKTPSKIISNHSEGIQWRKCIYLTSWSIWRIPFPNDSGVIPFSKQFKAPGIASEGYFQEPSSGRSVTGFTLPLQKVRDKGRVLSQFAKTQNKGSAEWSPWFRFIWPKDFKKNDCSSTYAPGWVPRVGLGKVIWLGVQILPIRRLACFHTWPLRGHGRKRQSNDVS